MNDKIHNLSQALSGFQTDDGRHVKKNRQQPLKVLHLLSQQPAKTGSGVYLLAMTNLAGKAGYQQRVVIGLPGDSPLPEVQPLEKNSLFAVRFDQPPVPFCIPGMSDIMPYPSTRFSTFTDTMREGYFQAFWEALNAAADGFEPDIIHSHHLWLLTALARIRFPDTPICVSSHGTELRQLKNAPQLAPFVLPGCRAVDRVFALHEENKQQIMAAYGIPESRIQVTGAGFRSDLFRPADACIPAAEKDTLTIVYAGKISAPKGVPWLIEAMRRIQAPEGKTVRLLLAGAAGEGSGEEIGRQAADLENVMFLGALSQEELSKILGEADVFVLPSFFEGLPLVLVESLACECRVVTTDLPGLDTWMPEDLCAERLVEKVPLPRLMGPDTPVPEDLPGFVDNLANALTRQLEAAATCRGETGISCRVAGFSWEGVFERIQAAYLELAGLSKTVNG
ncbi:MAG: glycosyltransferase [Desulfobacteraceae bacterium]|nr:MAG: glycosyltransferase [Desulfobacteraceae bacterium]